MRFFGFIKKQRAYILLSLLILANIFVNSRINIFRYNNFDFGKFDLGNMSQMLWNTLNGRFMYLTDYFGTDLPRWAMSHVDPILLLFLPLFAVFQHPLVLVFSQFILVILASVLVFKIADLELKSKFAALLISAAYLFNPSIGYLNATTGYHGVTVVIPFFLMAFYLFEKMYKENKFSKERMVWFWVMLAFTMAGKEQLPLYIFIYAVYILIFRSIGAQPFTKTKAWFSNYFALKTSKIALSMMAVSLAWFVIAFFVLIPQYAHYRVEGFQRFAQTLDIDSSVTRDVEQSNYFLSRYEEFGTSYGEIAVNLVIDHEKAIKVFFGGDRLENLKRIFEPVGYVAVLSPFTLLIAAPDFFINFLTTVDGVGTSEVTNHRISMILPLIFISVIYGISFLANYLSFLSKNNAKVKKGVIFALPVIVVGFSIYTTFYYNNPVYLWLDQAVRKRILARQIDPDVNIKDVKVGDIVRLTQLDNKDAECALKVVQMIPDDATVSGPDYLGAHLSLRKTYAIFPALYTEADYVILDVFSRKILTILDIENTELVREVVNELIKSPEYELLTGCGNLFVFKNVGAHEKSDLLPLQERFEHTEKYNFPILYGLTVVDFDIPAEVTRGENKQAKIVYVRRENQSLDSFILYTTYVNTHTGELYQLANLPSFSIIEPEEWVIDKYYIEDIDIALPQFLDAGNYKMFVGLSNKIRTRNLYLGEITVK
jgi:uncharacterized membrane protein